MMRFLAVLLLAAVTLLAVAACTGGSGSDALPQVREAHAQRTVVDGAPQLSSLVLVQFDRDFELAPSRVPLASHFELSLPDGAGGPPKRALAATAEVSTKQTRTIELTVDAVVPDGSEIRVEKKAFDAKADGDIVATVSGELTPPLAVLASKAIESQVPDLLARPEVAPVTAADRDTGAQREALIAHLDARQASEPMRTAALTRFDELPANVVPSPKLRAALAALTGTFAELSVNYLFSSDNCTEKSVALIAFQPPPDEPELLARATKNRDGARVISVNPTLEGDRIEHLMPILAHEAIHCDNRDGRYEEIAATALDTLLYLQLVVVDPTLLEARTPVARDLNIDALAMLNSGRSVPESLGVLKSPGVSRVVPNSDSQAQSFADLVAAAYAGIDYNESPDEPLANAYASELAERATFPVASAFNLVYLDELIGRSFPPEALALVLAAFRAAPV